MFWFIYRVFNILEIFTGKIILFDKKKKQEITRMAIILPKSPKYSQRHKMSKKKKKNVWKFLIDQNSLKSLKRLK